MIVVRRIGQGISTFSCGTRIFRSLHWPTLRCFRNATIRRVASAQRLVVPFPRNRPISQSSLAVATTVYALSTPPGKSAVAVIRISGPMCTSIYRSFCPSAPAPAPRKAVLRVLYHPADASAVLDPGALVIFFPGPHSFTGEDILEFHVHGGPAVLKSILAAIPECQPPAQTRPGLEGGGPVIVPAEPGEFTRRAFYNSKLSLPQIEALGETLSAETEQQRLLSVRESMIGPGTLTSKYEAWRSQLVSARAELEALIDFSEDQQFEETPAQLLGGVRVSVARLLREMRTHAENAVKGELMRNGIRLALLGAPNAGKSSLLNRIIGREAVIVSAAPGTTRDVVDVAVDLNGWLVLLGDTAGLRAAPINAKENISSLPMPIIDGTNPPFIDDIEIEGMKRAEVRARQSDIIVLVIALKQRATESIELEIERRAIQLASELIKGGKTLFVALNKIDNLPEGGSADNLQPYIAKIYELLPNLQSNRVLGISCTSTEPGHHHVGSVQALLKALTAAFSDMTVGPGDSIATTARQKALVEECTGWLEVFLEAGEESCDIDGLDVDIVLKAEELRNAAHCLARITGKGQDAGDVEEVLGVIFQKFCVGK